MNTEDKALGPYDGHLYYFSDGTTVQARDTQDAFRLFRVERGGADAILSYVRPMRDVWDEAARRSACNND